VNTAGLSRDGFTLKGELVIDEPVDEKEEEPET
jgi:hypothetical protein